MPSPLTPNGDPAPQQPGSRNSFLLPRGKSVQQFFERNWLNVVVLLFALGVSAAATAVSYAYANSSIDDLSIQLRSSVLENINNQINGYLTQSTSVIPVAKIFLEDRTIDTGVVSDPDIKGAATLLGKLYASANITSLFFVDNYLNNLGWGQAGPFTMILMVWQGYGSNFYIPVGGTIGNISEPVQHKDGIDPFPDLDVVRASGKPKWGEPYILVVGDSFSLLLPYLEPAYFDDTGEFLGVVGSNVKIDVWETVLNGYKIGNSGKVFITSEHGLLLADSNIGLQMNVQLVGAVTAGASLPDATENDDPLLAAASKYLVAEYKSFEQIPTTNQLRTFKYNGENILLLVGTLIRGNLILRTVVVVPQSDFTGSIDKGRNLTIGLTVAASVMGALNYMPWGHFYRFIKKHSNKNKVVQVTPAKMDKVTVTTY